MLEVTPMAVTAYEINAYSSSGLFISLKIITPIPNTIKLEIKVNELRRLFNLSRRLREHVKEGTKLM